MLNYEHNSGFSNARTNYSKHNIHQNCEITERLDMNNGCVENRTERSQQNYNLIGFPLASVYSPIQEFAEIYDCEMGLSRGTIFAQLDLPFVCGGMNGGATRG